MDDLTTFLNSVESSARKILKQQNKKQQQQAARDRVALIKGSIQNAPETNSSSYTPTREVLRATYASGGSLVIPAPISRATCINQRSSNPPRSLSRSEDSSDDGNLPRLPPARSPVASMPPGSIYSPLKLPTINRKGKQASSANNTPDKRSPALKLLESPLYKSLTKLRADTGGFGSAGTSPGQKLKKTLQNVDNVALLLRKMGLHDSTGAASPAHRADHAVDKRMCNACWAKPDKITGCEHHSRVYPTGKSAKSIEGDALSFLTSMELQGPTSWLSDDIFVKYRSEKDREKLWFAYVELKTKQQEIEARGTANAKEQASLAVIPIVTRHPICALFETLQNLENLRTQAETRKRNLTKTFVFDVNHIWLTNLDHFNHRPAIHHISDSPEEECELIDPESLALSDRRDERAIREGYSQIQSISTERALKRVVSIGGGSSYQRQSPQDNSLRTTSTRRRKPSSIRGNDFRPLSLLVCGRWSPEGHPNALQSVPGVALVGDGPVLWWRYDPDHETSEEGERPPEYTKTVALFERNSKLSSSNAILVVLVLALDAPILSPVWFAWHVGSKMPPPELEAAVFSLAEAETGFGRVMVFVSPCLGSLRSTRLDSVLDELLPGTITLLNDAAEEEDHWLQLVEQSSSPVGHRRGWGEFTDRHTFRHWLLLTQGGTITPRFDVVAQFCSVTIAHPNAPGVCGRYCWHEVDPVEKLLCRRRVEKDLLYIIQNHLTSGPNDPSYFSALMSHETMADVLGARLSSYLAMVAEREARAAYEKKLYEIEQKLEAGRLALEAKRQEQKRLEQELEAAAAQAEARSKGGINSTTEDAVVQEWAQRMAGSAVVELQGLWEMREITLDSSGVVFYHSLNEGLPVTRRFQWGQPEEWKASEGNEDEESESSVTSRSELSAGSFTVSTITSKQQVNSEAQQELMRSLLEDEQFLQQLKAKLGLTSRSRPASRAAARSGRRSLVFEDREDENDARQVDLKDEMDALVDEAMDRSKSALVAAKVAKLQLKLPQTTGVRVPQPVNPRGEGWKRLKTSRLPPNFARTVYSTHTEGPRSSFMNQTNHATLVGMLDPADCSPYDPPEFIPELRAHFVPRVAEDLHEKKRQWAELMRSQQAETPNAVARRGAVSVEPTDDLFEHDTRQPNKSKEQIEARALLCARNNNLEGLELALDQGVDVNARDNHGNTLFILACQQGNKRLAKFLLRRRADMNLQNLNGNTALHYLYAYKHTDLAEYLKAKGAKDTTQNAAGLTCYEGLSQDDVDSI
ncbi:uncharacterized protein PITG_17004 [Phytophthora infestans T30-4]|uniref:Uncharacterized protein n=1 Tax=Phytophthora infestans (strain T30-4) TaxID=403677 RepID=D0NUK3_PHYIT|nr:uncharacterized protein PITG_17004 [Phytophthora infestans T30-4]EEY65349.1 conserved hypothetical protein [Phytophthora infestans T30-4]|eukprot:XP_002897212.1 conserved hypothetical protein [Phytophthora infestans T30-4]